MAFFFFLFFFLLGGIMHNAQCSGAWMFFAKFILVFFSTL